MRRLKSEVIEYTVVLAADSAKKANAESLSRRLRATSSKYVVKVVGDEVEVMVPAAETGRFLQDWGGAGATVSRERIVVDGPPPTMDRIRFRYVPGKEQ